MIMAKEAIFLPDLAVRDVFLTQMHRGEISASKLNSETCTASMETIKGGRTGNSKITAAEIVCVTKCHFTLDLLTMTEGRKSVTIGSEFQVDSGLRCQLQAGVCPQQR